MSEWIDKLSQQIESAETRQQHVRQMLPVKADEFWNAFVQTLEQDVRQINEKFKHRIGEVDFRHDQPGHVHIFKAQFPAYYVDLTFLSQVPTIKVEITIANNAQSERKIPPYNINFELDVNDKLIVKTTAHSGLSVSRISENLLTGLVQNKQG